MKQAVLFTESGEVSYIVPSQEKQPRQERHGRTKMSITSIVQQTELERPHRFVRAAVPPLLFIMRLCPAIEEQKESKTRQAHETPSQQRGHEFQKARVRASAPCLNASLLSIA